LRNAPKSKTTAIICSAFFDFPNLKPLASLLFNQYQLLSTGSSRVNCKDADDTVAQKVSFSLLVRTSTLVVSSSEHEENTITVFPWLFPFNSCASEK
jgi:hypothetical protein